MACATAAAAAAAAAAASRAPAMPPTEARRSCRSNSPLEARRSLAAGAPAAEAALAAASFSAAAFSAAALSTAGCGRRHSSRPPCSKPRRSEEVSRRQAEARPGCEVAKEARGSSLAPVRSHSRALPSMHSDTSSVLSRAGSAGSATLSSASASASTSATAAARLSASAERQEGEQRCIVRGGGAEHAVVASAHVPQREVPQGVPRDDKVLRERRGRGGRLLATLVGSASASELKLGTAFAGCLRQPTR
eukprot:scaffold31485_cov57-Phaeocystis_antarctica.AAC.4